MKKLFLLLAFFPAIVFAQTKTFTITGNVSGLADGPVNITTTQQDHAVVATGNASNGSFTVTGSIPEPG